MKKTSFLAIIVMVLGLLVPCSASAFITNIIVGGGASGASYNAIDFTNTTNYPSFRGWWAWENNFNDSSTLGQNLTEQGTHTFNTTTLIKSGSYSLNGGSNYLYRISNSMDSTFPGRGAYTGLNVSFWLRYATLPSATQWLVRFDEGSGFSYSASWIVYLTSANKIRADIFSNLSGTRLGYIETTNAIDQATDVLIDVVWDGSYLRIYKGTASAAPTEAATAVSCSGTPVTFNKRLANDGYDSAFIIGGTYGVSGEKFSGIIEDVTVHNAGFTASEVGSLWQHGPDGAR